MCVIASDAKFNLPRFSLCSWVSSPECLRMFFYIFFYIWWVLKSQTGDGLQCIQYSTNPICNNIKRFLFGFGIKQYLTCNGLTLLPILTIVQYNCIIKLFMEEIHFLMSSLGWSQLTWIISAHLDELSSLGGSQLTWMISSSVTWMISFSAHLEDLLKLELTGLHSQTFRLRGRLMSLV